MRDSTLAKMELSQTKREKHRESSEAEVFGFDRVFGVRVEDCEHNHAHGITRHREKKKEVDRRMPAPE